MLVVGGAHAEPRSSQPTDGGSYDLGTDSWASLPTAGAPLPVYWNSSIWTGSELILWGGINQNAPTLQGLTRGDGAAYNPATQTWRPLSLAGAPSPRARHSAVWTGTQMIIWGGSSGNDVADGAAYEPTSDAWRPITSVGAPARRDQHSAVWTGTEMIIWGGDEEDLPVQAGTGGRYNPATDSWLPVSTAGAPSPRWGGQGAVWTGTCMLVWGGEFDISSNVSALGDGGRYDPATDTWSPIALAGAPAPRLSFNAVWTGTEMLVWGGRDAKARSFGDGARYDPVADSWSAIATENAPGPRDSAAAVWTGTGMLVWGGFADNDTLGLTTPGFTSLGDGAIYVPPSGGPCESAPSAPAASK